MTRTQLERLKRLEAAHSNCVEHFPFFFGTVVGSIPGAVDGDDGWLTVSKLYMTMAKLSGSWVNGLGLGYTVARAAYVVAYYYIEGESASWLRTGLFWATNFICFVGIGKSAGRV